MPALALITVLYEFASGDELFRMAVPPPDMRNGQALDEYLARIGGRLANMVADPNIRKELANYARSYRTQIAELTLPRDAKGG
jgi:hypothetical protein